MILVGLRASLLVLLLLSGLVCAEVAIPSLSGHVVDLTGTLDATQSRQLETRLAQFEVKKGVQIAVLLVPTTKPETIEQYGIRVVESWKLGRKGLDDGVLLLIAKDDHALRVEVGYGLEGVLPDAVAKRIIAEVVTPRFKRAEYYTGIAAGIEQLVAIIEGESLPPPRQRQRSAAPRGFSDIESLMFVGFILVIVVGGALRKFIGRLPAAIIISLVIAALAWLIAIPLLIAGIAGIVAFIFTLISDGRTYLGGVFGRGDGGFGDGGFGGGGFSGGGGGFGGGGASGQW